MGFWGDFIGTVVDVGRTVINTVVSVAEKAIDVTKKIGGAVMRGVENFISQIPIVFGPTEIDLLVYILTEVIPAVIDFLGEKPEEERPEELGRKAEIACDENHVTPEDFESTEEYIRYLREEIHADRKELEAMTPEDKMKYAEIGAGLYVRSIEEKYGTTLEPEFWRAAGASGMGPDRISALIPAFRDHGVKSGKLLDDYFSEKLLPGSPERGNVADALTQAVGERLGTAEIPPILTEINQYAQNYNRAEK